jgi:hypothetical protein
MFNDPVAFPEFRSTATVGQYYIYPIEVRRENKLMREGEYVDSLISEYETVLGERELKDPEVGYVESQIVKELCVSGDWSTSGASELLRLANNYGAFMLRNALAIAVVLGKEDGSEGF